MTSKLGEKGLRRELRRARNDAAHYRVKARDFTGRETVPAGSDVDETAELLARRLTQSTTSADAESIAHDVVDTLGGTSATVRPLVAAAAGIYAREAVLRLSHSKLQFALRKLAAFSDALDRLTTERSGRGTR